MSCRLPTAGSINGQGPGLLLSEIHPSVLRTHYWRVSGQWQHSRQAQVDPFLWDKALLDIPGNLQAISIQSLSPSLKGRAVTLVFPGSLPPACLLSTPLSSYLVRHSVAGPQHSKSWGHRWVFVPWIWHQCCLLCGRLWAARKSMPASGHVCLARFSAPVPAYAQWLPEPPACMGAEPTCSD